MIKATKLTEKSWLLSKTKAKFGLLRETKEGNYAIMGGPHSGQYGNLQELESVIGQKLKFVGPKETKENKEEIFVEGYPIKHETFFPVEYNGKFHAYTKREGSSDLYAAGYFGLQFKGKWYGSYCPRVKTLEEHPWMGPFTSKLELDHTTRMENNK